MSLFTQNTTVNSFYETKSLVDKELSPTSSVFFKVSHHSENYTTKMATFISIPHWNHFVDATIGRYKILHTYILRLKSREILCKGKCTKILFVCAIVRISEVRMDKNKQKLACCANDSNSKLLASSTANQIKSIRIFSTLSDLID